MPRVLIAADKFKGSLTGAQVLEAISAGIAEAVPDVQVCSSLIADGGDGTLDAAVSSGFTRVPVSASGPFGEPVETSYAVRDGRAVVEMADACGIVRAGDRRDALRATSRGVGDVMRVALDSGIRDIVLGIGGSASTDGGAGMLQALGARLLDAEGADLPPGGGALARLAQVDLSTLHPALAETTITLASDVNNPLLGEQGCVAIFAGQKGADEAMKVELEAALTHYAAQITAAVGRDDTALPGAGAAGGVGYAAMAVLGAGMTPGIDVVLGLGDFTELLPGSDLVITGEGALDLQTLLGKAPAGVARAAKAAGVPVIALCGVASLTPQEVVDTGLAAVYRLVELEPDTAVCMRDADRLLRELAARAARDHFVN
ncbi:Glycerate 2-kinase [Austwickia sp. TVS 96-490-7B]|uniref:glycerate kinase n=1 Tax=Austwickia sp. TVS 96-490-7B TaxID=2830843 RepID=UPI001C5A2BB8|nr:glycerate kinase [Austwickia sp. TVS 96-490-7B]MBW3084769.1 Glycerate 2-kinase [Austwickia sp. TVS 96-490-7B]